MAGALDLEAVSITDHDTLAGYDEAKPYAERAGLELICGVELSTRPHMNASGVRPPSVHLLGYFFDGGPSAQFRAWLASQQQSRRERNRALIVRLGELGVDITLREVEMLGGGLPGRPHFARVLQEKGYVSSRQEAFDTYLADGASASVDRMEPNVIEAAARIRNGNGLAALAHPVRLESCDPPFLRAFLSELVDAGLNGIEVYHSDHSPEATQLFRTLALEFELVETGGSDFHGDNKPGVRLGSGRGDLAIPYSLLDSMRARYYANQLANAI